MYSMSGIQGALPPGLRGGGPPGMAPAPPGLPPGLGGAPGGLSISADALAAMSASAYPAPVRPEPPSFMPFAAKRAGGISLAAQFGAPAVAPAPGFGAPPGMGARRAARPAEAAAAVAVVAAPAAPAPPAAPPAAPTLSDLVAMAIPPPPPMVNPVEASLALEAAVVAEGGAPPAAASAPFAPPPGGAHVPTARPKLPRMPGSSCMSSRDVAYVVRSHMRPLETADSYTDDYYNHTYARRLSGDGGRAKSLVAPVWVETKAHATARAAHMANDLKNVTQKWEEGNRVLGHVQKSDVARPTQRMAVSSAVAEGERRPFSGPMWLARDAVDAGSRALLDLEECRSLGHATAAGDASVPRLKSALLLRLRAVAAAIAKGPPHGSDTSDANVAYLLGQGARPAESAADVVAVTRESGAVFAALMALPKGVKLLARFVAVMPATAAASPLLRAVLETPRPAADLLFHEHDDALHAALRDDAFVRRVPFKTLVDLADGLAAAPTLYELIARGDELAANPHANARLAADWRDSRE